MSNRLSFGRGQAYLGTNADQPPNWNFNNRDPSVYDTQNVSIGDLWMNTIAERIWCLVSLEGSPTSKGALATWLPLGGGFGNGILTLEGNAGGKVPGDITENINLLGSGPYVFTGNVSTNTLTLSDNGVVASQFTMDDDTIVVPVANNVNIFGFPEGGPGIGTTASASDTAQIFLFGYTEHGVTIGTDVGGLKSLPAMTNGQLVIGQTGADPAVNTLTAGANITITNGAGSITIASTGGGGGGSVDTLTGNTGGAVSPDGDGNINIVGDTFTINITGDPGTNTLTASTGNQIAAVYDADTGSAAAASSVLNIFGSGGVTTSASGNTITINGSGSGSGNIIRTDFTTSGTWTKNANTQFVEFLIVGGGGGGGSGRRGTILSSAGGGAGGAGSIIFSGIIADAFTTTTPVIIGSGGAGAPAATVNDTDGTQGVAGDPSNLGSFAAGGGMGGPPGNATGTGPVTASSYTIQIGVGSGPGAPIPFNGSFPGSLTVIGGGFIYTNKSAATYSASSGGSGGAATSVLANARGVSGGSLSFNTSSSDPSPLSPGGLGGLWGASANGAVGNTTYTGPNGFYFSGTGGGGGSGYYSVGPVNAGNGGNGGYPGGGGGGGGASIDGLNSGAGGSGADGMVIIWEYL